MAPVERRGRIMDLLRESGRVTVDNLAGVLASEQIRLFHASDVVLSAGALDIGTGLTACLPQEADIARAMLSQARTPAILTDATKLGKTALFEVCPLDRIDRLVNVAPINGEFAAALRQAAVDVVVASE